MKSAAEFELSLGEGVFSTFREFLAPLLKSFPLFVFMGYFLKSVSKTPFSCNFLLLLFIIDLFIVFFFGREREREKTLLERRERLERRVGES